MNRAELFRHVDQQRRAAAPDIKAGMSALQLSGVSEKTARTWRNGTARDKQDYFKICNCPACIRAWKELAEELRRNETARQRRTGSTKGRTTTSVPGEPAAPPDGGGGTAAANQEDR